MPEDVNIQNTAKSLSLEIRKQLNQGRMSNCSSEDFLLNNVQVFFSYKLGSEDFLVRARTICQFPFRQYNLAVRSFAQTCNSY